MIRALVFIITMVGAMGTAESADLAFTPSKIRTATQASGHPRSSSGAATKASIDVGKIKVSKPRKSHQPAAPPKGGISPAGPALNKAGAPSSGFAAEKVGREEHRDRDSGQRATLQRHSIQKQRADLQRQHSGLERKRADLDGQQALFKSEKAKLRQEKARLTSGSTGSLITCNAARAVVADYGFKAVRPEQCTGKIFKFGATRDGTVFSIDVSPNGELANVRRLP
jgi:hypothetical protein